MPQIVGGLLLIVASWCLIASGVLILSLTVIAPAVVALRKESREGQHHEWIQWSLSRKTIARLVIVAILVTVGLALMSKKGEITAKGDDKEWEPAHNTSIVDAFR